jgi:hypothetical protein
MNPPGLFTFLLGNPISALALIGGGGWMIWQWWEGAYTLLGALLGLLFITMGSNHGDRFIRYAAWRREWRAAHGGASSGFLSSATGRWLLALALFALLAYPLYRFPHHPWVIAYGKPAFAGWAMILGAVVLFRMVQKLGRVVFRRKPRSTTIYVTTPLPVPARAPTLADAVSALPNDCLILLARNAEMTRVE